MFFEGFERNLQISRIKFMKIRSLVIQKSPETTFLSELSVLIKCTKIDSVSDAKKTDTKSKI